MRRIHAVIATTLAAGAVVVGVAPPAARADSVTVTSGTQLRDAIDQANVFGSTIDTILIDAPSIVIPDCTTPPPPFGGIDLDDANATGDYDYTGSQDLTIRGIDGAGRTVIDVADAGCLDRVFDQHHPDATLTLEHLSLRGSIPRVPIGSGVDSADYSGGAVRAAGNVTLANSDIFDSKAGDGMGANAALAGAAFPGDGGAVAARGDVVLDDVVITDSQAGAGGSGDIGGFAPTPGGNGGAIYADGHVRIVDSGLYDNAAGRGGLGRGMPGAPGGDGGTVYARTVELVDSGIGRSDAGAGGDSDEAGGAGGRGGAIRATVSVSVSYTRFDDVEAGAGGVGNSDRVLPAVGDDTPVGGPGGGGGAIMSDGSVVVVGTLISNARAGNGGDTFIAPGGAGGSGGAILGEDVTITDSHIERSRAGDGGTSSPTVTPATVGAANGGNGGNGGGVAASASVNVTRAFLQLNEAGWGGDGATGGLGGDGGAIASTSGGAAVIALTAASLDQNASGAGGIGSSSQNSSGRGGAVFTNQPDLGAVEAYNTSFTRNRVGVFGATPGRGSTIAANNFDLTFVTITDSTGSPAIDFTGTGPAATNGKITASVLADNPDGSCATAWASVMSPYPFSTGWNVEDGDTCGFDHPDDLVDTMPDLSGFTPGPGIVGVGDPDPNGVARPPIEDGNIDGLIPPTVCDSDPRIGPLTFDQWGTDRPSGDGCEPGAIEIGVNPVDPGDPGDPGDPVDPTDPGVLDDAAKFVPLEPERLFDTREVSTAPGPKGKLAPDSSIDVQITGVAGVPADAVSVVMNVTAINATAPGYVTVWAKGQPRPLASNLNLALPGQTRPNLVTVPIGADGQVSLYSEAGTHLAGDVAGYFVDVDVATSDGRVVSLPPTRLFDTRESSPAPGPKGKVPAGGEIDVQVLGEAGVPTSGVSAVVMNLTGASATAPGYVTAYPTGTMRPLASVLNLNFVGAAAPNLVMLPVGTDGRITLYAEAGAHLLGDVTGYVTDTSAAADTEGLFVGLDPVRVFDTRPSQPANGPKGVVAADASIDTAIGGVVSIPSNASAVMLNLTGVNAVDRGYVTGYPTGTTRPLASVLNLAGPGDTRPNATILPLGSGGELTWYAEAGAHLLADTSGYFLP